MSSESEETSVSATERPASGGSRTRARQADSASLGITGAVTKPDSGGLTANAPATTRPVRGEPACQRSAVTGPVSTLTASVADIRRPGTSYSGPSMPYESDGGPQARSPGRQARIRPLAEVTERWRCLRSWSRRDHRRSEGPSGIIGCGCAGLTGRTSHRTGGGRQVGRRRRIAVPAEDSRQLSLAWAEPRQPGSPWARHRAINSRMSVETGDSQVGPVVSGRSTPP